MHILMTKVHFLLEKVLNILELSDGIQGVYTSLCQPFWYVIALSKRVVNLTYYIFSSISHIFLYQNIAQKVRCDLYMNT